ncbi:MAG: 4Fe-4S cluster-binding domain-containing protein [Nitrospirae bacterium]|nr:4Fe-4S cluster-binding domain-containing protein [Nitrospirota bacterium]
MPKYNLRFFVGNDGRLYIDDMSPLEADILGRLGLKIDKDIKGCSVSRKKIKNDVLKNIRIPLPLPDKTEGLVDLHNTVLTRPAAYTKEKIKHGITIYKLKKLILEMYLKKCRLCGFQCIGHRAAEGKCPILKQPHYNQCFVHLGEEKEVGTTCAIEMVGCNIHCKFCQKGELINPTSGIPFNKEIWKEIKKEYENYGFDSISFLGGNPDQSIKGILDFLEKTPEWAASLPVVWHTNGYSKPQLYNLLNGLIDLWVIDFKYFKNECAVNLSGTRNYVETAQMAVETICSLSKDVPVIIRHLLLPGHTTCCQKPLIEWLTNFRSDIIFHPMSQYKPLWNITEKDGELFGTIKKEEVEQIRNYAIGRGIVLTQLNLETF